MKAKINLFYVYSRNHIDASCKGMLKNKLMDMNSYMCTSIMYAMVGIDVYSCTSIYRVGDGR